MDIADEQPALLTLDELADRVGMSVRNIRFYTTKRLVPPPLRRGRSGYYTADHVARLELVRELQSHGFTLSAIKGYVDRIPEDATPSDIALHLSLLAPMTGDSEVDVLDGLVGIGVPASAAEAVAEVYARHGQQVADELSEIVRTHVWPAVRDAGAASRTSASWCTGSSRSRSPAWSAPTSWPWTRARTPTNAEASGQRT